MKNLSRAEFYRFRHQTCTWVILIVFVLMAALSASALGIVFGNADWVCRMYDNLFSYLGEMGDATLSMEFQYIMTLRNDAVSSLSAFIAMGTGADLPLILAIYTAAFFSLPNRSGYRKNLLCNHPRTQLFRADARVLFVFCLILLSLNLLVTYLVSFVFFKDLSAGNPVSLAVCLLIRLFLAYVIGLIMIVLCDIFKRSNTGPIISILYVTFGSSFFFTILDALLSAFVRRGFKVEYLTPFGNYQLLSYLDTTSYLISAVCGVVYLVLCLLTEYILLRRKDVI